MGAKHVAEVEDQPDHNGGEDEEEGREYDPGPTQAAFGRGLGG